MKYIISPTKRVATDYSPDAIWIHYMVQLESLQDIDLIVLGGGKPVPTKILDFLVDRESTQRFNITFVP